MLSTRWLHREREMTLLLHDYLEESARQYPTKTAIVAGDERVSFGELNERANRLAFTLSKSGTTRGDRVAILGESSIEVVTAVWASLKANLVFMVVSRDVKVDKLSYILDDSGARVLIGSARLLDALHGTLDDSPSGLTHVISYGGVLRAPPQATLTRWTDALSSAAMCPQRTAIDQDLASIVYTSGSTGEPKGVMLTHANMLAAATSITTYLEAKDSDIVLCALPLAFDYGLYQVLMAARVGATVILESGFTYPSAILDTIVREGVTAFPAVPTMFAILTQMRELEHDLSRVRYVTNTAAALPVSHLEKIAEIFPNARIYSMYGLTECKRCTYLPPEDLFKKPTSVGIAIPNTELWIEDEHGRRLGAGQVGQLVIRGATVMRGYWRKPEATAKRLRPGPLPGEQVLHTGDYARLDEDGYLYFVSRMDDIIKSRGEKVAPREVEDVLYALAGVREAAVIGVPDPVLGHAIKAFIVADMSHAYTAAIVIAHCKSRLEPFMVPKHVEFRDALPKTDTGKIKKSGLY
jgi:amino acid adenylation domain-containing protein